MNFIKIYRDPVIKKIVWTPTTVCNYKCSYCPTESHDGKYRWPDDYSRVINFINAWRGDDPLTLDILGGEPTLWPDFTKFCQDLVDSSPHFTKIIFSSNGSRTLRYWKEFNAPISSLGLSYHPEYENSEHFLNVVKILHEKYQVQVYLMLVHPYLEQIKKMFNALKEYKVSAIIMSVVSKVNYDHSGVITSTPEYQDFAENNFFEQSLPFKGIPYRTYITDGVEVSPVRTQQLINSKQDAFKGWDCYVGYDTLNIHPNGDVYGSTCAASPCLGNIYTLEKIEQPSAPIKCPFDYCGCGTDIEIKKSK
jgi:MoaA/NifB/PqqE/SkfB family radical SAM enzyme